MSVYPDPRSPYYRYDFWWRGHRFLGSTKATTRRQAEAVERIEREKAKAHIAQVQTAKTSMRLDDVAGRYMHEVGQHHVAADNTWREIGRWIEYLGKDKLITEITGDDVASGVARRRGDRVHGKLIAPATVNNTTEHLRKLFTRAKLWGVHVNREPEWRKFWLAVPQERVRELVGDEGERLEAATRDDLQPFYAFAKASGLRFSECLLKWSEVDWGARQIRKPGKGGKFVTVPITPTIRDIIWALRGHDDLHVFTYIAMRTRDGRVKGRRYPLTPAFAKRAWELLREAAGVRGFRFHDYRHNLATKLLRETGNLKLVQKALNHADIATTTRYAHVLNDDVAEAMERVTKSPTKSPIRKRYAS
jgi:integrase